MKARQDVFSRSIFESTCVVLALGRGKERIGKALAYPDLFGSRVDILGL